MPTVAISPDAYRVLCGLVQPSEDIDAETVMAPDATWTELRNIFPLASFSNPDGPEPL